MATIERIGVWPMRELEVQLSKKDILRMMSDMRLKKDG